MSMNDFNRRQRQEKTQFHSNPIGKLTIDQLQSNEYQQIKYQTKPTVTTTNYQTPQLTIQQQQQPNFNQKLHWSFNTNQRGYKFSGQKSNQPISKDSLGTNITANLFSKNQEPNQKSNLNLLSHFKRQVESYKSQFSPITQIQFQPLQFTRLTFQKLNNNTANKVQAKGQNRKTQQINVKRKLFPTQYGTQIYGQLQNQYQNKIKTEAKKEIIKHLEEQRVEKNYKHKTTSKKSEQLEVIRNMYKQNRDINFQYRKQKFISIFLNKPINFGKKLQYDML